VRNPYTRILSSFFDKICGIQRNGKRYRGNLVPLLIQKYGIEVGGDRRQGGVRPDQELPPLPAVRARHDPLAPPDGPRHPLVGDVGPCLDLHRERRALRPHLLDRAVQRRDAGRARQYRDAHPVDLAERAALQRKRRPRPEARPPGRGYFDDLSMHLVYEIYKRDFELFRYDFDARGRIRATRCPSGEIDLDEVHAKLGDSEAYRGARGRNATRRAGSRAIAAGIVSVDGDTGFLGTGALTWSIDLGDANATEWVTQIGASTYELDDDPGARRPPTASG
jgi:hypothetical protein